MRGERRSEVQRHGEGREMTTTQQGSRQGEWYGYIQPYRYYGPGYRGVGYYSVLYQGADPDRSDEGEMDEPNTQFDQRNVHYGQGQGAGAAWDVGRRQGQFTGRGPKGYQRSDERIREDVSDRLMEHPDLDASEIEVKVSKGVVTLTGGVDSRWDKRLAEDIADAVSGVRDVMNQLSVSWQAAGGGRETASARGTAEASAPDSQPNGRRPATTASR
jgi:osmotically-inducible protein OsmY